MDLQEDLQRNRSPLLLALAFLFLKGLQPEQYQLEAFAFAFSATIFVVHCLEHAGGASRIRSLAAPLAEAIGSFVTTLPWTFWIPAFYSPFSWYAYVVLSALTAIDMLAAEWFWHSWN